MKTTISHLQLSGKQPTIRRRGVGFCLRSTVIVSLTLVSATVFGAPPWAPPVTLSKPAVNAESPAVAISQTGMMAAAWSRQQGSGFNAQAAVNLNGTWKHGVNLGSGFEPDIAIDDAGVATAVWSNGPAVQSSRLLTNGRWSRPITLSETGTVATLPQIVVDRTGNATAIWVRYDSSGAPNIETASCPANGHWSNPAVLASGAPRALNLVVNTAGDVAAIWDLGSFVSSTTVYTSDRPFGSVWSTPYPVAPAAYRQGGGTIGIDDSGNLTACWRTNTEIRVADKPAGGAWAASVTLYTNTSVSDYPLIAKTSLGDDMVALIVAVSNGGGYNYQIRTCVRPMGGSWTPVEALTSQNEYDTQLHAGTTNGGSFVLSWVDDNKLQVKSSTRTVSTAWAPFTVVTAGEFGTDLAVADNTAVAIWLGGSFQAMVSTLTVSP